MDAPSNNKYIEIFRRTISSTARKVITLDKVQYDRLFALLLLIFVGTILLLTPRYSREAQLFPLVIGIPTVTMLVALLILLLSSRVTEYVEQFGTSNMFDFAEQAGHDEAQSSTDPIERRYRVAAILLWIGVLLSLIFLVGFVIGIAMFLVSFYRYSAEQSWTKTLLYSSIVWSFIYIMFVLVLNTPLYEGIL